MYSMVKKQETVLFDCSKKKKKQCHLLTSACLSVSTITVFTGALVASLGVLTVGVLIAVFGQSLRALVNV